MRLAAPIDQQLPGFRLDPCVELAALPHHAYRGTLGIGHAGTKRQATAIVQPYIEQYRSALVSGVFEMHHSTGARGYLLAGFVEFNVQRTANRVDSDFVQLIRA